MVVGAVSALWVWWTATAFLEGRYLTGRGGSRAARDAWDAYGPGAFAADSAVYLLFAVTGLVVVGVVVTLLLRVSDAVALNRLALSGMAAIGLSALASLVLLIVRWSTGVPFRNFQSLGADDLLYGLTCLIPAVALGGVIAVLVRWLRFKRPTAPGLNR